MSKIKMSHFSIPPTSFGNLPHVIDKKCWKVWNIKKNQVYSIDIPNTISIIGKNMFFECKLLQRVEISSQRLTIIRDYVFAYCFSLVNINIPRTVRIIGVNSFRRCRSLKSITIPKSVKKINKYAFCECSSLKSLTIESQKTVMKTNAFKKCIELKTLIIKPEEHSEEINILEPEMIYFYIDGNYILMPRKLAFINAFNEQNMFPFVNKIWAPDSIIAELKGPFEQYKTFKQIPRKLRAAPDATTWSGVELWMWWQSPSYFGNRSEDGRVQCKQRIITIWNVMLSAYRASEVLVILPELEPELWEHILTFLKHENQPV